MLSTDPAFFLFAAIILALYYSIRSTRLQTFILSLGSFAMYAVEGLPFLLILLASCLLTTLCSYGAGSPYPKVAKAALSLGVVINLLVLATFKYSQLIVPTQLLPFGTAGAQEILKLGLPIGISFYTFHGISLVVDAWHNREILNVQGRRGSLAAHLLNTSLYLSFFPQLVAGPITKGRQFFPQIERKRFSDVPWTDAFKNIIIGLFLKRVIADNLNELTLPLTDARTYATMPQSELFAMVLGYSAQIFADFAGYSLIAIGIAKLFGYRLPDNFNQPYLAQSITEFWRRWHMSLSSWLREYLYIPLGGNRHGTVRTYVNLLLVMGLGGLWHGADWKFAIWGLWHGALLAIERALGFSEPSSSWLAPVRILITFVLVTVGWLFFRLGNVTDVGYLLWQLVEPARPLTSRPSGLSEVVCMAVLCGVVICFHIPRRWFSSRLGGLKSLSVFEPYAFGLLAAITLMAAGSRHAFIYFQF
jgi:alginate O-acetyltransferase complex protein AlgI